MNTRLVVVLLSVTVHLFFQGCQSRDQSAGVGTDALHIAAAANLSYVMDELLEDFRDRHPRYRDLDIQVTRASSGSLASQVRNNAPYDLFLAANTAYAEALFHDSLTAGPPVVYAEGVPVLIYRNELQAGSGLDVLVSEKVKTIAVAQPELAPYGQAAIDIMTYAGVFDEVRDRLVYGASVTQTFQQSVAAADAGFIAKSLLYGDKGREVEKAGMAVMEFLPEEYRPEALRQAMVLLDPGEEAAVDFYSCLQGDAAGKIFTRNGYRIP
ncbi:MAG TPA: molybdate ABC transporter substrate-binding protein [Prosthecochloris aestuarii]|uniref:Molybdate ABC transporter substrate-binding protein n=1 Tax=Prosthecochloris aestuarii TaxID=1102 RepID=A0A831SSK9_PROAE|nr:molybdate ABC transporter substrate-binding protein [Prosthecochloris aestuarii]